MKTLKILGLVCGALVGLAVTALIMAGSLGPGTAVYPGRQIPKRFMTTIRSLNLLTEDEEIKYFYSDAMLDIKAGMCFVTDKHLVLYSSEWEEPKTIIPLGQIVNREIREIRGKRMDHGCIPRFAAGGLSLTTLVSAFLRVPRGLRFQVGCSGRTFPATTRWGEVLRRGMR